MENLERILVVDDQHSMRAVLALALAALPGVKVSTEASGEAALAAIHASPPDLLLLDAIMPGLDGPQTLHALRARATTTELPVIFLTASADSLPPGVMDDPHLLGVIGKPFDAMRLGTTILQLWDSR